MKRLFACIAATALLASAQAEETPPSVAATPAAELVPQHHGYAVDRPGILLRQRLFGLAHGLSLLAAACLDLPDQSAPIQEAYAAWRARQDKSIEAMAGDLALYYFGRRAAEANWQDLTRALKLADDIRQTLGDISLHDACASLPTAIVRPRYEFDRLLAESAASAIADTVSPAPTSEKPAR